MQLDSKRQPFLIGHFIVFLGCWGVASWMAASAAAAELEFRPRRVVPHPLPAITNAPFVSASEATAKLVQDEELVLGVVVQGRARAYPINMLTGPRREIINDELGGQAIAATW
jgi:hypothetical protein